MSLTLAMLLAVNLSGGTPAAVEGQTIDTAVLAQDDDARRQAALDWLKIADASDWEASFAAAGRSFRNLNTVKGWREASQQARVPFGTVQKREALTINVVNAPPHGYIIVRFMTVFEGNVTAFETVTLEREGEELRVVGYVIE